LDKRVLQSVILLGLGIFFLVTGAQVVRAAEPLIIIVEAGSHDRIDTPVSIALEQEPKGGDNFSLIEITKTGGKVIPAQIEPGNPPRLWFILTGKTPAGSKRTFQLLEESNATNSSSIEVKKDDKTMLIHSGKEKILQYNQALVPPPPGKSELYTRSAFIHPLWSPSQKVLTNIHPEDHVHHMGIWMPWTHTRFEGKDVDFWNLPAGEGTVRFVKFISMFSGAVCGGFQAEQNHVALKTKDGKKVVLKEIWDVRAYNVGGPEKGYRIVDFVSTQTCVAKSPLYLPRYRYGGFGFRGNAEWKGAKAAYLTSEGKTRKDGHRSRARWCDTSGQCGEQWVGVTHMSHPENFRHPESMRIWPGYDNEVFFNWSPIQLEDWVLEPGKQHVFRYRMLIHEGEVNVEDAERVWQDFGDPPFVYFEDKKVHM